MDFLIKIFRNYYTSFGRPSMFVYYTKDLFSHSAFTAMQIRKSEEEKKTPIEFDVIAYLKLIGSVKSHRTPYMDFTFKRSFLFNYK